jgi:dTDP-4-dehydrorhamnose 3,5-epimerase
VKSKVFQKFGEIYFSCVNPGIIKGWHLHKKMILNYAVPFGKIKLVLFDLRKQSKTKGHDMELFLGPVNYQLVTVPPGIWNGFQGLGTEQSIVANCASIVHDPAEIIRIPPDDPRIGYNWKEL